VKVVGERNGISVVEFASSAELWSWLDGRGTDRNDSGVWVSLPRSGSARQSVTFGDVLEAGIAFGWSESTRLTWNGDSYLQRFTPRRRPGTLSSRNVQIADRLRAQGRMTPAGERALGR
jgi:uncharacterized protein YdeI (YjbR/CyaY-like superfamily)